MPRKGESIFKRQDGRWEARYIHHYENDKAIYRYLYGKTYSEAKHKRIIEQNLNIKQMKKKANMSFGEVAEEWLETTRNSVKESTYTRYVRIVQKHLVPRLSYKSVMAIEASDINRIINEMLNSSSNPLSPKTVVDIICVFKSIAKYGKAKKYFYIDLDLIKYPPKDKKMVKVLDRHTIIKLEKSLVSSEEVMSVGIIFALYSGVRIGELCGIKWEDIDLKNLTVTINRTIERIADLSPSVNKTKVIINTPKTDSSRRVIPIPKFLKKVLQKHSKNGNCYFLTGTEKYIEPHSCYIKYKKILSDNNIDHYSFHALRHTFATRCVEAGVDIKSLSEMLGHSSINTTLSVYVHPSLEQKRLQLEKVKPSVYL